MTESIVKRLRTIAGASANRRIAAASLLIGLGVALARAMSMLRDLITADRFGTGDDLDAYFVALAIPFFAQSVIAGSFNVAFVPTFIRIRDTKGSSDARQLVGNVVTVSALLLAGTGLVLAALGPLLVPLVASGFTERKLSLTLSLYFWLLPLVVIGGMSTLWTAVLTAGERFALASVAQLSVPLAPVVLVLLFPSAGIMALTIGTVAGALGETAILGISLRRQGFPLLACRICLDPPTRGVIGQYLPLLAGAAFMSASPLIDQAFATRIGNGTVSTLQYGNRLVSLLLGVAQLTLGTAVLPHVSRMAAAADYAAIRHTLRTFLRIIAIVSVPVTALAIALSHPIVSLVYQRGAFTASDTDLVSSTQSAYLLQVPFYIAGILGVRVIAALQGNRVLMWISLVNTFANAALDCVLMNLFGVVGIALATSLVYINSSAMIFLALSSRLKTMSGSSSIT